jgi:hypothetical protein
MEERRDANAEVAGSTPAGRIEGPWCKRKHGELQPRWSGFESWRICRRGPKRSDYLVKAANRRAGSNPAPHQAVRESVCTLMTATRSLLRAGTVPVIDS